MKYQILYIFLLGLLLASCKSSPDANLEAESVEEESAPLTIAAIRQNDRIKIGAIVKNTISPVIRCTGQIDIPPTEVNSVHSKISGQISNLTYIPGDYVKRGSRLATVENPSLIEKQRTLLETKAKLEYAAKDFERKKLLKAGQATPEKTYEESEYQYQLLMATYNGLKKELELLGIDVVSLETNTTYQSAINVYAAHSGYVHEVLINQGQMITPEIRLMDIADIDHLHLELQILAKDIGGIKIGQMVTFTLPQSGTQYQAKVVKINPMVNSQQATLQVHCHIEHPEKKTFVAGLFVNAEVQADPQELEGLPISAVIKEGDDYYAYKVSSDKLERKLLSGVSIVDDFVLFDGAKEGEWITAGAYYLN